MSKKKIIVCDRILEVCLLGLIFFLPFSKAGIEIWLHLGIACWLVKRSFFAFKNWKINYKLKDFLKAYRLPNTFLNKSIYLFAIILFISFLFGVNFWLGFEGLFGKFYTYFMALFLVIEVLSRYNPDKSESIKIIPDVLHRILYLWSFSFFLIIANGFWQWFFGKGFMRGFESARRLQSSFGNPNSFAGWLVMLFPVFFLFVFVVGRSLKSKKRIVVKLIYAVFLLAGLTLLVNSFSRGAWIGFIVSLVFLYFLSFRNKTKLFKCINKTVLIFIAVLALTTMFYSPVKKRFITVFDGFDKAGPRKVIWEEAVDIIEDYPLLGIGPNTYSIIEPYYRPESISKGYYPHNCYLHLAVELGLPGIAVFLWILWCFFSVAIKKIRKEDNLILLGITAGLLAFLVQSFFDTNLFELQLAVLFWLVLGFGVVLIEN